MQAVRKSRITGNVEKLDTASLHSSLTQQLLNVLGNELMPEICYSGAPPHWPLQGGKHRPVEWPLRSPDLSSLDFIVGESITEICASTHCTCSEQFWGSLCQSGS